MAIILSEEAKRNDTECSNTPEVFKPEEHIKGFNIF